MGVAPGTIQTLVYPAHGWLPPGAALNFQRDDQGKDFVTNWRGIIQAPGDWKCVQLLADAPFPNGFGPHYCYITITSGPFAGHTFYIGHCTALVSVGQTGHFGDVLAKADQGHPSQIGVSVPGDGGWVELGEAFWRADLGQFLPGPNTSSKWFDPILATPLVVTNDPYHYLDYPTAVPLLGRLFNERTTVMRYDQLRVRQTPSRKVNTAELALLRKHLGWLAGRALKLAKSSTPPAWQDSRHLGERFQGLIRRSQGELLT